jgi:16S rRNA processing protein RimM
MERLIMIQYLDIGKIVNTHGVKGEVKVIPLTDNPERYSKLKSVYIESPSGLLEYHLSGVKYLKNFVIVKFEEVEGMDAAEALKDKVLKIDRANAVKLPKNSFFICDLIGCEVIEANGTVLGKLKDILQTGSNDVYTVVDENKREILIPALKSVVNEISIENKRITVTLPKGLLDDEV